MKTVQRFSLFSLVLLFICLCSSWAQAQEASVAPGGPYSIAVLNFDNGGERYSYRGSNVDAATIIPSILTTELANSPRFTVIEREQLEKVLKEQNLGRSGAISAETAAAIGEVLGVSYLVTGHITEFNIEEGKSSGFSAFGISSESKTANKAKVSIEVKVIDTESARIVAAVGCRKTFEIGKGSSSSNVFGFGNKKSGDKSDNSGLTDTMYAIASDLADQLNNVHFKALPPKIKFKGFIALIDGEHLYINLGKEQGIKKKMVFKVYREKVKAGITIKVNLAEIQVVNVDETSSECAFLKKNSEIKAGDLVESKF